MKQETQEYDSRYKFIVGVYALLALVIFARLIMVESSGQRDVFVGNKEEWELGYHIFYPPRGDIFDRYGNLLAGSEEAYEVGVDLTRVSQLGNAETIAFALRSVLAEHPTVVYSGSANYYEWVLKEASTIPNDSNTYRMLADYVSVAQLTELKRLSKMYDDLKVSKDKSGKTQSLNGLIYRPRMKRIYPEGKLGANILGFVDFNGVGLNGVEETYDIELAGVPEAYYYHRNPLNADQMPQIPKGTDLILTIDRDIQAAVEDILIKAVQNTGSASGTILVMDPRNGEMLAIATTPMIDPNNYWKSNEYINSGQPYNRAVNSIYEPGSVFKVITMGAALNEGVVTPDETMYDPGYYNIGGIQVVNWDGAGHGNQTMTECMQHSLNVCLAYVANEKLGFEKFYKYVDSFGFGRITGIDLGGEVAGLLRTPVDEGWYEGDLGTNSYGQGLAVTPIQMMQAVSAIANDGMMSAPHVLKGQVVDGRQFNPIRPVVGMPVTAETARTLTEMLAISLEEEASNALVNGYRVAGKTGTASVATPTGYSDSMTNASFVGWGPADDPSILIYVWLEKPTSDIWGSVVAAPVFSEVFKQVAIMTKLPPDAIRQQINGLNNSSAVSLENK